MNSTEPDQVSVKVSDFAEVLIGSDGYLGVTDEDLAGAGVFLTVEQQRKIGQALLTFAAEHAQRPNS